MSKTARPRLGLPYTVLQEKGIVRLVCGEDFRYTLRGPGLESWLPDLLTRCDGRRSLDELLASLDEVLRGPAQQVIDRLYAERVLVDGTAADAHAPHRYRLEIAGQGALADLLRASEPGKPALPSLAILCQDSLDYEAANQFNRRCLRGSAPWLWASSGAMNRGYVGPVFLPGAGPCLACLLRHFQGLSPAPELYDALAEHVRAGKAVSPVPFPAEGMAILGQLVFWKLRQLQEPQPAPALYQLHVLETATMEVTTHRVFPDPECPECGDVALV
jgi:bacteriocin biosynthesis cyclodehydratase domain-containing protein